MYKTLFKKEITNVLEVAEVVEYLNDNYSQKLLMVAVWENFLRKPDQFITAQSQIVKLNRYLIDNWANFNITIAVQEVQKK